MMIEKCNKMYNELYYGLYDMARTAEQNLIDTGARHGMTSPEYREMAARLNTISVIRERMRFAAKRAGCRMYSGQYDDTSHI